MHLLIPDFCLLENPTPGLLADRSARLRLLRQLVPPCRRFAALWEIRPLRLMSTLLCFPFRELVRFVQRNPRSVLNCWGCVALPWYLWCIISGTLQATSLMDILCVYSPFVENIIFYCAVHVGCSLGTF